MEATLHDTELHDAEIKFSGEEKIDHAKHKLFVHEHLLRELGNGADWSYDRVEEDSTLRSKCICGMTGLRWCFIIKHRTTGKEKIVGSSCIERLEQLLGKADQGLVAELQQAFEVLQRTIREKIAAARELSKQAEVDAAYQELLAKHQLIYQKVAALYRPDMPAYLQPRINLDAYRLIGGGPYSAKLAIEQGHAAYTRIKFKPYKSKPAFLKAIQKQIALRDYSLKMLQSHE